MTRRVITLEASETGVHLKRGGCQMMARLVLQKTDTLLYWEGVARAFRQGGDASMLERVRGACVEREGCRGAGLRVCGPISGLRTGSLHTRPDARWWGVVVVGLVGRGVRAGGEGAPPDDVLPAWGAGQVYRAH